jgi:Ca2+-binding EF-hand superfamily protein
MITDFRNIFEHYDKKKLGYIPKDEFISKVSEIYKGNNDKIWNRIKKYGLENDRRIMIDSFILLLKPDNIKIPQSVLANLRNAYNDKFNNKENFVVIDKKRNVFKK